MYTSLQIAFDEATQPPAHRNLRRYTSHGLGALGQAADAGKNRGIGLRGCLG